eukprot:1995324-Rhodomonas_salina.2
MAQEHLLREWLNTVVEDMVQVLLRLPPRALLRCPALNALAAPLSTPCCLHPGRDRGGRVTGAGRKPPGSCGRPPPPLRRRPDGGRGRPAGPRRARWGRAVAPRSGPHKTPVEAHTPFSAILESAGEMWSPASPAQPHCLRKRRGVAAVGSGERRACRVCSVVWGGGLLLSSLLFLSSWLASSVSTVTVAGSVTLRGGRAGGEGGAAAVG